MARIDDYKAACKIAREKLALISYDEIVRRSGFKEIGDGLFQVPFLDRIYIIACPDFSFRNETESEKDIPLQEQVLILHYIQGAGGKNSTGNWIAYREVPGASFYFAAFVKRAIDPLKQVFGQNVDGFIRAAHQLGGTAVEAGDAAFEFTVFPHVPTQLILHAGDEEFPPEANILFDDSIGTILSPEDVAWMAGMVVYRLMALVQT